MKTTYKDSDFYVVYICSRGVSTTDGGGWKALCIMIVYSEPRGAESREVSSALAESSRVFTGDVILDLDWLAKFRFFVLDSDWLPTDFRFWARNECVRQCNTIGNGNRQSISIGYSVFVMYKDKEWAEWLIFGTVGLFRKKNFEQIFFHARGNGIITGWTNYDACG